MQRFDENGNFVNLIENEEVGVPIEIQAYFTSESKIAYSIVANNEEEPNAES
jgi:hypothetical protein